MSFDYKNKSKNVREQTDYLFSKTNSMFNWFGLPETIPSHELEKILQKNGVAFIYEFEGEVYAFSGAMSGELDVYGNFKQFSITNTALNLVKIVDIKDGVLISNDTFQMGLKPLFDRYATMLVENDITMVVNGYNTRIQKVISASDDKTIASAEKYIEKIVTGEIGIIGESALFEGVKTQSTATGQNPITSLVEYQQYLKASLYNEIGINANFNMKRDRLASSEVDVMADAIFPFVDNMLTCREKAIEQMFEKFAFEISVEYGSIWKDKRIEVSTAQNPQGDVEDDPTPQGDVEDDPTPQGDVEDDPAPQGDVEDDPTPQGDVEDDPAPQGDVEDDPAPQGDVEDDPAPQGDVEDDPAPQGDVEDDPAPQGDVEDDPAPQGDVEEIDVETVIQIEIDDERKAVELKIEELENNSGDPAEIEELKIQLKDLEKYGDGK